MAEGRDWGATKSTGMVEVRGRDRWAGVAVAVVLVMDCGERGKVNQDRPGDGKRGLWRQRVSR